MGCNTSRGATVVDPSEKPEERPKTVASNEETPTEETNGEADEGKDQTSESSSWVMSHFIQKSPQSKKYNLLPSNYAS